MMLEVMLVFIGGVIGSLSSSGVIMHLMKRHDKVEELVEKNNRIAEGLALMSECEIMMLDALHDKGIVNGNGENMRSRIQEFMLKNTNNGYKIS